MSYSQWKADALKVLANYGMDQVADCYSVEAINLLLKNNIEKAKDASTFEATMKLADQAIQKVAGIAISVSSFLSKDHQDTLYMLFSAWRAAFLKENA